MQCQALLDKLKTDCHIPIALAVFAITTVMHLWTKRDLGPQYVNSLYAMYAFLGGHAWVNRDTGDSNVPPNQP
jgi:hypothetical protein